MKEFTETSILKHIGRKLPNPDARVLVGFGDDTAVYKIPNGKFSCITTDAFVENKHFSLRYFPLYDIGVKSLTSALSDIAAVGGIPSIAVISLFIRKGIYDIMIDEIYNGILKTAKKYWVNIVGGDIVKADELAIVFTIVGEIDKSSITLRSGAKPNDIICVTGTLGGSFTGRMALEKNLDINTYSLENIVKKHLQPEARLKESQKLLKTVNVHSMIDISDGLSTDIVHIAEESRVGVHIEADNIPISEETKRAISLFNLNPIEVALKSGEEYELLFTIPKEELKILEDNKIGIPITPIGRVTEKGEKNLLILPDGTSQVLIPTGYNHFS